MDNNLYIKKFLEFNNITEDALKAYNRPTELRLAFINDLCLALHEAKHIVIMPDFDNDGISAGICYYAGFKEVGLNVDLYIPKASRGYGITMDDVTDVLEQFPDVDLVLTCDVGSTIKEPFEYLMAKGIKVCVTDHHRPRDYACDIFVNPYSDESIRKNEFFDVCGAVVAFEVLHRYTEIYANKKLPLINKLKFLAGFGTISDVEPVIYYNRGLIRETVSFLKFFNELSECEAFTFIDDYFDGCEVYKNVFRGLFDILTCLKAHGKLYEIDEGLIGFYIAPMFNSAKRMGEDVRKAFGVWLDGTGAEFLFELNEMRKETCELIKAIAIPYGRFGVVWTVDTPLGGMLGLVANSIMSDTNMPVFVFRKASYGFEGSGRTPDGFDGLNALKEASVAPFVNFADGHSNAFGIGINDIDNFTTHFEELMLDILALQKKQADEFNLFDYVENVYDVSSATYRVEDVYDYIRYANKVLRPFGNGMQEPSIRFYITKDDISNIFVIGSNKQHIKIQTSFGLDMLYWNSSDRFEEIRSVESFIVYGKFKRSEFNGFVTVNFIVDDVQTFDKSEE